MHSLGRTEKNARAAGDHVNSKWRIPIKLTIGNVLEGPGVLIGTALMYVVAKFVFPYGFLAATDQNQPFSSSAASCHAFQQLDCKPSKSGTRGWGDFECAAFGSVLAATDPVAVVGLLKAGGDFSGCPCDWHAGFLALGKSDCTKLGKEPCVVRRWEQAGCSLCRSRASPFSTMLRQCGHCLT